MGAWVYAQCKHDRDEELMASSLSAYRPYPLDPDDPPATVPFVETSVLYEAYLAWMAANTPSRDVLQPQQFGIRLPKVLGVEREFRQFRTIPRGKGTVRVWGYIAVEGPKSVMVPMKRGRPYGRDHDRKEADEAAAPSPEARGPQVPPH